MMLRETPTDMLSVHFVDTTTSFPMLLSLPMDSSCLSGSWDGTLRLWEINSGKTTRRFVGHSKDVLSVAFSVDNRQIVSGSHDKSIKLWNTLGECKYTIGSEDGHSEWVS